MAVERDADSPIGIRVARVLSGEPSGGVSQPRRGSEDAWKWRREAGRMLEFRRAPGRRSRLVASGGAMLLVMALPAGAQTVPAGAWDVTSTVVELDVPGVPGFIRRLARGRSKAEHKQLTAGQGLDALLAPDPKARCRILDQRITNGRYQQTLSCPQKHGEPLNVVRTAHTMPRASPVEQRWPERRRRDRSTLSSTKGRAVSMDKR